MRPHKELFSNSLKNELQREGKRLESVESFREKVGWSFLSLMSITHKAIEEIRFRIKAFKELER